VIFPLFFFSMADELSNLWANLSLAEEEDGELEIQTTEVRGVINRGQLCIIGKLLSERIISKETIKITLLGWPVETEGFFYLQDFGWKSLFDRV
jgi:hypothetical protein